MLNYLKGNTLFVKCPACETPFKKSELAKLKYHMEAYKDEKKYTQCHRCGRFFVTNIICSLAFLIFAVSINLISAVYTFLLDSPKIGFVLSVLGVTLLLFRGYLHQYLPVIDVDDTDL